MNRDRSMAVSPGVGIYVLVLPVSCKMSIVTLHFSLNLRWQHGSCKEY